MNGKFEATGAEGSGNAGKILDIHADKMKVYYSARNSVVMELKQQARRNLPKILDTTLDDFSKLLQRKGVPPDVAAEIAWHGLNEVITSLKS